MSDKQQTPDAVREAANDAAFHAIYGKDADPHARPEGFAYASEVADAILAALDSRAGDAGEGPGLNGLSYDQLWNAIADATSIAAPGQIAISVMRFRAAVERLSATPAPAVDAVRGWTPLDAWQELSEYTDRTSPAEYPDMCLITFEELRMFMARPQPGCVCGEVEGENDECPLHGRQAAVDAVPAGEVRGACQRIQQWMDDEHRDLHPGETAAPLSYDDVTTVLRAALSHGEGRK